MVALLWEQYGLIAFDCPVCTPNALKTFSHNPHQALASLHTAIMSQRVNWVLDADIRGFFDSVDHEWLLRMLAHRIADPRVLRLVRMWLEAGILESDEWHETDRGSAHAWPRSSCTTSSISGSISGVSGMRAVGFRSCAMPTTSSWASRTRPMRDRCWLTSRNGWPSSAWRSTRIRRA
jgi:hypothetical protein